MSKLSEILLTKVMQLLPDINVTVTPSKGTEAILLNTRNLYDILLGFYERKVLSKIFKKEIIRLYLGKVKTIEVNNRLAAEALRDDISYYFGQLEFLDGVVEGFAGLRIEAEDIVRLGF